MNKYINLFKEYFEYKDGFLYWKKTIGTRAIAGNKAGKLRKDGYFDVGLFGKYYLVHRIVYALFNNSLPKFIDHIDRDRSNNRIENLREASANQNTWNASKSKANNTGVKGVRKTKNSKFEARVAANGITYQVGTFDTIEQAEQAIILYREKLHKEFTCNG